uniref:Uncharacterized protein n=1 Tax=Methanococcus maripaludis (strain C6 / ATCC BAA-1332) TaxID=444158 RepID=A9A7H8_METM6
MVDTIRKKIERNSSKKVGYYGFAAILLAVIGLFILVIYFYNNLAVFWNILGFAVLLVVAAAVLTIGSFILNEIKEKIDYKATKFGRSIKDRTKR